MADAPTNSTTTTDLARLADVLLVPSVQAPMGTLVPDFTDASPKRLVDASDASLVWGMDAHDRDSRRWAHLSASVKSRALSWEGAWKVHREWPETSYLLTKIPPPTETAAPDLPPGLAEHTVFSRRLIDLALGCASVWVQRYPDQKNISAWQTDAFGLHFISAHFTAHHMLDRLRCIGCQREELALVARLSGWSMFARGEHQGAQATLPACPTCLESKPWNP